MHVVYAVARGQVHDPFGSSLEHRDVHAALARDLDGAFVAGIHVAHHAHARIGGQDALQLARGQLGAVGDDDHARVLAVADARAATVVDAHPGRPGGRVDERVEERPVGDGVRAVAHRLRLAVG